MHGTDAFDANCTLALLKNIRECDMMFPDICKRQNTTAKKQANSGAVCAKGLSLFNEMC